MQYVFDDPAYVPNYLSPPYLSCTPDVHSVKLDPQSKFLVIATGNNFEYLFVDVLLYFSDFP